MRDERARLRTAMRVVTLTALAFLAASTGSACQRGYYNYSSNDLSPSGMTVVNPMLVDSHVAFPSVCRAVDPAQAPSEVERSDYMRRLSPTSFVVIRPLNVPCLSKSYSLSEVQGWAKRDDPVAIYIYLYKNFRHIKQICERLKEVDGWLDRAYEAQSPITNPHPGFYPIAGWLSPPAQAYSPAHLHRLPEAFALKAELHWECGVSSFPDQRVQIEHGYDPLNGRPLSVQTD